MMRGPRSASPAAAGRTARPVLPFGGEGDLLEAGHENRVEVVAHLDEDELAAAAVLAVEVDDGVAGSAGAGEVVEGGGGGVRHNPHRVLDRVHRLRVHVVSRLQAQVSQPLRSIVTSDIAGVVPHGLDRHLRLSLVNLNFPGLRSMDNEQVANALDGLTSIPPLPFHSLGVNRVDGDTL